MLPMLVNDPQAWRLSTVYTLQGLAAGGRQPRLLVNRIYSQVPRKAILRVT
jgi:hypothetical protein